MGARAQERKSEADPIDSSLDGMNLFFIQEQRYGRKSARAKRI